MKLVRLHILKAFKLRDILTDRHKILHNLWKYVVWFQPIIKFKNGKNWLFQLKNGKTSSYPHILGQSLVS